MHLCCNKKLQFKSVAFSSCCVSVSQKSDFSCLLCLSLQIGCLVIQCVYHLGYQTSHGSWAVVLHANHRHHRCSLTSDHVTQGTGLSLTVLQMHSLIAICGPYIVFQYQWSFTRLIQEVRIEKKHVYCGSWCNYVSKGKACEQLQAG